MSVTTGSEGILHYDENLVALAIEPVGVEFAGSAGTCDVSLALEEEPDPQGRITYDTWKSFAVETAVFHLHVTPDSFAPVHAVLAPNAAIKENWNSAVGHSGS